MRFSDAIDLAVSHGWSDDSRYLPSNVESQVSTLRDGFLAAVVVPVVGKVKWNVIPQTETVRGQRGTAETVEAAMRACDDAISALAGALF